MNRAPSNTAIAAAPVARQSVTEQPVMVETVLRQPAKPAPDPQAGGSYVRDPQTGALSLEPDAAIDDAPAADQAPASE